MSVVFADATGRVELRWAWEPPGAGVSMESGDLPAARAFLLRLRRTAADAFAFRRLAAAEMPVAVSGLEDAEVIEWLAAHLARGRLRARVAPAPPLSTFGEVEEETPIAATLREEAPLAPARTEEPDTFAGDIDAAALAAAMREAARRGVPFCEECTKKRLARERAASEQATFLDGIDAAALAAAMREAARRGVPFCEECTRKRAARQRSAARGERQ